MIKILPVKLYVFMQILILAVYFNPIILAQNWSQWRGPHLDGISTAQNVPIKWDEKSGENILWIKQIPQWGRSTPVIWEDRLFITSQTENGDLLLLCYNRDSGEELYRRKIGSSTFTEFNAMNAWNKQGSRRKNQEFHYEHNMASPSVSTDGKVVICHFGNGDLAALDIHGNPLWKRNLQNDYGTLSIWWGHANTPVLYKNLVITAVIQDPCREILSENDHKKLMPSESYLVAHDKLTGNVVWRTLRMLNTDQEPADSYITPTIRDVNGQPQMLVVGGLCADAYNPLTGERIWWYDRMVGNRSVSGPCFAGNLGIFIQGHQKGLLAVTLQKKGALIDEDIAWRLERNCPDCSTPTYYNGMLFMVNNNGIAQCVEASSGKILWNKRLKGKHRASPIITEGNVYFLSMDGKMVIMRAADHIEVLEENQIQDETLASPVIQNGRIYLRGREKLYCIQEKMKK